MPPFTFPGRARQPTTVSLTSTPPESVRLSPPESGRQSPPETGRQSPPEDNSWEELDLSSTRYARRRKELMQLISDLRSMGAHTLIDLPSIVVIGGQSAGKSSLVEAVSGVNVPRDSGTCTRCPMECTMSTSATTWTCKIKLRFDYDSSGNAAVQHKEVTFGPIITDKNDLDVWLRRAQAAILNPDLPPADFHRKTIQELRNLNSTNSLKFSRNVVSIFIEDPGATDLFFVDLPGLIQNEDREVLDLVQELTESYIRRPNTIILTTIPMSDDMQNQLSVRLAREADPEGERTIGVLTKPDTLGDGAVNAKKLWLDVIEGRQHKLKNGYYCVRLPDDGQRAQRLSRSALQRLAADYFDTTSPWKDVTDRERFGIRAFVSSISVLFVDHIDKVLPQLKEEAEVLLASCLKDIGTLPKPLEADPQIEVLVRVNEFCDALKKVVSGASSDKSLAQKNRALYSTFAQEIRATSPDFRPFEQPEQYVRVNPLEPEEADVVAKRKVQIMGVLDIRRTIKESTGWELPGNIPYEAKTRLMNQFTVLWSAPAEKCLASINDVLDAVIEKLVEEHFGQFRVLQDLILNLIRLNIDEHMSVALRAIKETLKLETCPKYTQNLNDFNNLKDKWLAKYLNVRQNPGKHRRSLPKSKKEAYNPPLSPAPPLQLQSNITDKSSVDQASYHLAQAAYKDLTAGDLPCLSPRDQHSDDKRRSPGKKKKSPLEIKEKACKPRPSPAPESLSNIADEASVDQALYHLAQAGYEGLTADDLRRLSARDQHFGDELVVMADVRAYFTIACKRIIDHIPLKIEHTLHYALVENLSVILLQCLMADMASTGTFADRLKELVSEHPAIQAQRARMEVMRVRLQDIKNKLVSFSAV